MMSYSGSICDIYIHFYKFIPYLTILDQTSHVSSDIFRQDKRKLFHDVIVSFTVLFT